MCTRRICDQGPKCGRGGRGQPPTTRLAESKVGFLEAGPPKVGFLVWCFSCPGCVSAGRQTISELITKSRIYF